MTLPKRLTDMGFSMAEVDECDLDIYYAVSRTCYEKYVDEYFGGWVDDIQRKMNRDAFDKERSQSFFRKLLIHGEVVGFFAFDELHDKIEGVTIQMIEKAQNKGVGSFCLQHIVSLSEENHKPIFLRVFMTNPAQNLYKTFGFEVYDQTYSHYLMRYDPVNANG